MNSEKLQLEITRCKEILKEIQKELFFAKIVEAAIGNAENAIATGDVQEMIVSYDTLKEIE